MQGIDLFTQLEFPIASYHLLSINDMIKSNLYKFIIFLQELSTEKISGSVLEQTRIVNSSQILLVWINKSMQVALTVGKYFG